MDTTTLPHPSAVHLTMAYSAAYKQPNRHTYTHTCGRCSMLHNKAWPGVTGISSVSHAGVQTQRSAYRSTSQTAKALQLRVYGLTQLNLGSTIMYTRTQAAHVHVDSTRQRETIDSLSQMPIPWHRKARCCQRRLESVAHTTYSTKAQQ